MRSERDQGWEPTETAPCLAALRDQALGEELQGGEQSAFFDDLWGYEDQQL